MSDRSSRFPHGWWLVPVLLCVAPFWTAVIVAVLR